MSIQRMLLVIATVLGMFGSDAFAIYASGTGRFMQRDPIGYIDSMNIYAYAVSNPMSWSDPFGLTIKIDTRNGGASIVDLLNKLCPEGDFSIDSNGYLKSNNPDYECLTDKSDACKGIFEMMNDKTRTVYIQNHVDSDTKNLLPDSYWLAIDPENNDGSGTVYLGSAVDGGMEGTYDDPANRPAGLPEGRVPGTRDINLGHELLGHAHKGLSHPDQNAYSPSDPVIIIENRIREDLGPEYGRRTGP